MKIRAFLVCLIISLLISALHSISIIGLSSRRLPQHTHRIVTIYAAAGEISTEKDLLEISVMLKKLVALLIDI